MKLFRTFFTFFTLLIFVFSLSNASAATVSNEKDLQKQLNEQLKYLESADGYIGYLEDLITEGNELAKEGLEKFLALEKNEQEAFLLILSDTGHLLDEISRGSSSITIHGEEFQIGVEANDETPRNSLAASKTEEKSYSLYVGSLKVSTIYSSVTFEHNGGNATKVVTGNHWHSNINPAMIWTKQTGSDYLSGGLAYHRGEWTVYATGGLGFINDTFKLWVGANATSRYWQLDSTHPNFPLIPWTKY